MNLHPSPMTAPRPFAVRAIAGAVLFTLLYSPILGGMSGTLAAAQAVQNTTWQYQYDANGNLTQITDPLGRVTNQSHDALNRLQQRLQPAPAAGAARPATGYGYDSLDHLATVTDPRNLTTSYTIDGLGNLTQTASPDTGITGNTYDAAGLLQTSKDARGLTTTTTYDALNRVTKIAYATGTATQFEYDGGAAGASNAKRRLTRMTDESGQTTYAYGPLGRLQSKTQTVGSGTLARSFTVAYAYGASGSSTGKPTGVTYPSGNRINAAYDSAGRISSLTLNPTNAGGSGTDTGASIPLLTDIGYQPFGPVRNWTWGNNSPTSANTHARGFDLDGRITSYPLGNGVTDGINRILTYDAASRIGAATHSGTGTGNNASANFNQSFQYDDLDRLKGVAGSTISQGYQYDANGNRTQTMFGGTAYDGTIDANSNKLTKTAGPAPAKVNTYDAAGNLTGDGVFSYSYSARGRLAGARKGIETSGYQYLYNGLGQRTKKSALTAVLATGANYYVYDEAGRLLGEYDGNGKAMQETVWLGDVPVAVLKQSVTGAAPNQVTATSVYYVYADHVNTPRVITRASDNQIVWRWDNADPFGMFQPDENPSGLGAFTYNPRFPGQMFDKETNLHYNYFRNYDPATGRYVQSDPIGLKGGINTYTYTLSNPISYTDPTGQAVPLVVAACMANPLCAAAAATAAVATAKACIDTAKAVRNWYDQRQTPDQEALGDLVRDVSNGGRKPVSDKDADTLLDWGREVGSNVRDDRNTDHWTGGPHIHIPGSGLGHIPVK